MDIKAITYIQTIMDTLLSLSSLHNHSIAGIWLGHRKDWPVPKDWERMENGKLLLILNPRMMIPIYLDSQDYGLIKQDFIFDFWIIQKGIETNSMERLYIINDFLIRFENIAINYPFTCLIADEIEFFAEPTETEQSLATSEIHLSLIIKDLYTKRQTI